MSVITSSFKFAFLSLVIWTVWVIIVVMLPSEWGVRTPYHIVYFFVYSPLYYLILVIYFILLQLLVNATKIKRTRQNKILICAGLPIILYGILFLGAMLWDTRVHSHFPSLWNLLDLLSSSIFFSLPYIIMKEEPKQ